MAGMLSEGKSTECEAGMPSGGQIRGIFGKNTIWGTNQRDVRQEFHLGEKSAECAAGILALSSIESKEQQPKQK